jgi:hypothetical protein
MTRSVATGDDRTRHGLAASALVAGISAYTLASTLSRISSPDRRQLAVSADPD